MGTVTVSLDTELAWGYHDIGGLSEAQARNARRSWRLLLDLFDEFRFPATWAVVGHLMLNDCDGVHADHPSTPNWFAADPGGRTTDDSLWFAPELVEAIDDADVDHDIGSHTFSHVEFGDPATTPDVAEAELRESNALADEWGIDFDSFVFPRNNVGYREAVADHGFGCYRGAAPPRWYDGSAARPLGKLASMTVGRDAPPLVTPEVDEYGMVNVPASMYLFTFEGMPRTLAESVGDDPVVREAKLGVDAAVEGDGVFHIWLHPNDLVTKRDYLRVRRIIEYASERERATSLRIETMRGVAERTVV